MQTRREVSGKEEKEKAKKLIQRLRGPVDKGGLPESAGQLGVGHCSPCHLSPGDQ